VVAPIRDFLGVDMAVFFVLSAALIGLAILGVAVLWNR